MRRYYTIYTYKEYKNNPEATALSRDINSTKYGCKAVAVLGIIGVFYGLSMEKYGKYVSIFCGIIVLVAIAILFYTKRTEEQKMAEVLNKKSRGEITEEILYKYKAFQRKANYFLHIANKKEIEEEADNNHLSVKEFKQKCKNDIEEYDEVFRLYNLTHKTPAEY